MASVYLHTPSSQRPLAFEGEFEFSRVPSIGEIVQVVGKDSPGEPLWFKVVNVIHSDRSNDLGAQVDAELFGDVMTDEACDSAWGIG